MSDGTKRPRMAPGPLGKRMRVMIEPGDQMAAEQVRERLKQVGATRVREITDGFISAEVPTEELQSIEALARTGILAKKKPLRN